MGVPIIPDKCLQPMLGVGTENELDVRIGDGVRPPHPPAQVGVYLDPDLGLWAAPAAVTAHGQKTDTTSTGTLAAGKSIAYGATQLSFTNSHAGTLLVSGTYWVHLQMQRQGDIDSWGQILARAAIQESSVPTTGPVVDTCTGITEWWETSFTLPFRTTVPPTGKVTVYGRVWADSKASGPWAIKQARRVLSLTAVTVKGG
ncbi:hypothetical protein [Streptomyces sp. NBC_01304]|uniref:hypothetical protein n=1 Tax=Streptomyces sp. NBC_01304 TaxID=2903818 RepID=UPI002E156270|nr:hypothetical protein OG430_44700 [Streptomyces sp. NBC_01304]